MEKRYYDLNTYFRGRFGCRVHKITVDAGLDCPNRDGRISTGGCIYCNARGSGTGAHALGLSIVDQLERGKTAVARRFNARKFIAYFQSFSNTYAPIPHLASLYDAAMSVEDVVGMAIGTRPDCVGEPVLDLIEGYADRCLVWMEYGLQSAIDATLKRINRGHDLRCFRDAVHRTRRRGIKVCAHVILGLPGEGREEMLATADRLAEMQIDGVKLHLLYVVRGTGMEALFERGEYRCMEQREYAESVCDFLERLPPEVVIQRLTGDPHPDELVAPAWALRKRETLSLIARILVERDSRQGSFRQGRHETRADST
ncbi:MAG: TIGR01212 family radical SAM protein [Desulfobacterales bacterium]